jgi:ribosome-interacting GTPase 1
MCGSLYVYNKIDGISLDFLDKLAREPHTSVMSCELDLGIQDVVDRIWQELRLIRIYTKRYCYFSKPLSALINSVDAGEGKDRISVRH